MLVFNEAICIGTGYHQVLGVNARVATVLGLIPASSDTVESEGRQMKEC